MAVVTPKRLVADLRDAAMDMQSMLRRLQRAAVAGELTVAETGDVAGTLAAMSRRWTGLLDEAADQMRATDAPTRQLTLRLA